MFSQEMKVTCLLRVKEMEASDPEHTAALAEYERQLAKREHMSVSNLLIRTNSAQHLSSHLEALQHGVIDAYRQILMRYGMDLESNLAALEGSLDIGLHVRFCCVFSAVCTVMSLFDCNACPS
jgi:hypothetical protein